MTDRKKFLVINLIILMLSSLLFGLSIFFLYSSSYIGTAWIVGGLSFLIIIMGTMFFYIINQRLVRQLESRRIELESTNQRLREENEKRRKIENAFREERDRVQSYLDIASVMFIVIEKDQKVALINKKGCEVLGYAEKEIIGKNWFDHFLEPTEIDSVKEIFNQLIAGQIEPVEYYENHILNKKGAKRLIAWHNIYLRNRSGDIIGTLSSGEDITDKKIAEEERAKLEAQLIQAQKMESIGTLAGGIAHDFNNILSSVIGYTELAMDETERGSSVHDKLNDIFNAGKRARDLVKQILTFARQSEKELKPIQVSLIAKEVTRLIRSSIPTTIRIEQSIESDSLIMGDPSQVHQIFMNLCTNSAHAMEEEGGVLTVGLEDVFLDKEFVRLHKDLKPGNYLQITIADTGIGISEEHIHSIFDPYFTTKGPGEGTGLGLAVVHGIVKSYGGEITVRSESREKTAFIIYLPIVETGEKITPFSLEELPGGNERILCIDDERAIVEMDRQTLERLGYSVTIETSGLRAIEIFKQKPDSFDLVITDMTMPDITGDRLAQTLKDIKPDIQVILCTGFNKKIAQKKAGELGVEALILKPTSRDDLARTVRRVLDSVD